MTHNTTITQQTSTPDNAHAEQLSARRKCLKSYKANIRLFDDYSIEACPQAVGEPSQLEVKKVGKSKRYLTNGKNPLACIELKVPADVPDRAAAFFRELDRLTKDIQTTKPELPQGELKLKLNDNIEVYHNADTGEGIALIRFNTLSSIPVSSQLGKHLGIVNQCFAVK